MSIGALTLTESLYLWDRNTRIRIMAAKKKKRKTETYTFKDAIGKLDLGTYQLQMAAERLQSKSPIHSRALLELNSILMMVTDQVETIVEESKKK